MKFSVITVNLNNAVGLRRTMESVLAQRGVELEYIVIDGLSTDGSVEVLKEHSSKLAFWVSESDAGIYQAMNKGTRRATGDYCLFLNSGDWLVDPDVLSRAAPLMDGSADVYYSDKATSDLERFWTISYPSELDENYFVSGTISHQNSLIRRSLLVDVGFYREDFRIISDWYFFTYALHRLHASFRHISVPLAYFFHEGISTDPRMEEVKESEHSRGFLDIFGPIGKSLYELRESRESVYAKIIGTYGYSRVLDFALRSYRFLMRAAQRARRGRRSA